MVVEGGGINVLSLKFSLHNSGHQASPNYEINKRKSSLCVCCHASVYLWTFSHNRLATSICNKIVGNLPESNLIGQYEIRSWLKLVSFTSM